MWKLLSSILSLTAPSHGVVLKSSTFERQAFLVEEFRYHSSSSDLRAQKDKHTTAYVAAEDHNRKEKHHATDFNTAG